MDTILLSDVAASGARRKPGDGSGDRESRSLMHNPLKPMPRELWVPDHAASACMVCGLEFGFFRRRHHCRHCGRVVCAECSASRIKVDDVVERVCDRCAPLYDPL